MASRQIYIRDHDPAEFPDGSRQVSSGRGFFSGVFNGMDVMVKCHENEADNTLHFTEFYQLLMVGQEP